MKNNVTNSLVISIFLFIGSILTVCLAGCDTPAAPGKQEEQATETAKTKIITTDSGLKIKITDLGTLSGVRYSTASSINDEGLIVGSSYYPPKGHGKAVKWENGKIKGLCKLLEDDESSTAKSINNNGLVIGNRGEGAENAFLINTENHSLTSLDPIKYAQSINNKDQVVGFDGTNAVLWDNGESRYLETFNGDSSSIPSSINDSEQIVGVIYPSLSYTDTTVITGYLWENGSTNDLGTLGGNQCHPRSINNKKQIVGYSTTSSDLKHAFLWEDGKMTDLGTLGGRESRAAAINDKGQIVGNSDINFNTSHAVLWQNGNIIDLGTLSDAEGADSFAAFINEQGQIVGQSLSPSGERHAVLWEIME